MTILHIAAVSACIFFLAYCFRVSPVEIMPVFTCGLVLLLYVLAMAGRLSWIDGIAVLTVAAFGIWLVSRRREQRKAFGRVCLNNMTEASFLTAMLLLIVTTLCTSGKVVTWWDDINFWATDVKSLYFLDGFAGKYANVAPEFGDYPPAAQLIKWWFLHLSPREFREGLAFAGYYVMNLVFLLPLLKGLKGRNVFVMFFTAAALWFMPSIAEVYGYDGFCADLTMACIYGGFLYAVTDIPQGERNQSLSSRSESRRVNPEEIYYYGRLGLYLGVLVLVKSIGFVWALFGLIFMLLYRRSETVATYGRKSHGLSSVAANEHKSRSLSSVAADHHKFRGLLSVAAVASVPVLTGGSWMVFCLIMRRVTKTTATAVKYMTTDEYGISGYTGEFARAFLKAFVSSPLHKEKSVVIDLTPLGLYLCICVLVILMRPLLSGWQRRVILWFTVVSGALFYGIIFVAHITIFATETQYLEAAGMISSIERYGAPFTIGTLLFLAGIWLNRGDVVFQSEKIPDFLRKYGAYLCFILFVALTAGYRIGYHGLVGYRQEIEAKLAERVEMIGADEAKFLETIRILETDTGARVCYIRRGDAPRWVNNSYTAYEASPISVVYKSVNLDDAPTEWMVQEIRSSHAAYLYAEDTEADAGEVFDEITREGAFACGVLYRIEDDGVNMELTRVSKDD